MVRETELFFDEVLTRNLSLLNFIDSDWTMLNERLARHYRIDGVIGTEMRKVSLKPEYKRGGVMTQASILKVSANGTTTSPVVRGAWILERIIGFHPRRRRRAFRVSSPTSARDHAPPAARQAPHQ